MDASIRSRSLLLSIVVHGALLLLLILVVMNIPIPPFPENGGGGGGVLIDIGVVDAATGEIQPMSKTVSENPSPVKTQPAPKSNDPDVLTSEIEVTTAVNAIRRKTPEKPVVKTETPPITFKKPVVEKPRTADPSALFHGSNTSTSQGTSTTGGSDQGQKQGVPGGSYTGNSGSGSGPGSGTGSGGGTGGGTGGGHGDGFTFDLGGRKLLQRPTIDDKSQETGKVVVDITVDRSGNVITADPHGRGSTNVSSYLRGKAREGAMRAKFSPNPNGAEIQKGTMTFVFVVQ